MSNSDLKLRFGSLLTQGEGDVPLVQWQLKPNCSVTPVQLIQFYVSLCIVSLGIGGVFWWQGASLVLPFAWLELMVVGAALVVYARHARDGEKIILQGNQLVVELESAGHTQRSAFVRDWVRVEPQSGDGSLIEVSGQGRSVVVGRYLRSDLRPVLAREIRFALRGLQAHSAESTAPR